MNKERQLFYLKGILKKKYPSDWDKFDVEAEIDSSLTYDENKRIILEKFESLFRKEPAKKDIDADELKYRHELQKRIDEQETELLKEWKASDGTELMITKSPTFFEVEHYIRMSAEGLARGTIIVGEGGLGKSYLAFNLLSALKKEFAYLN